MVSVEDWDELAMEDAVEDVVEIFAADSVL
jgi:hypothetical protein